MFRARTRLDYRRVEAILKAGSRQTKRGGLANPNNPTGNLSAVATGEAAASGLRAACALLVLDRLFRFVSRMITT